MTNKEIFAQIRENIISFYHDKSGTPDEYYALMNKDGSFCDLDYSNQNWTAWPPFLHMVRVKDMCRMYATPENPFYKSEVLKEKIILLLKYFIEGNFRSDNWWMNDIGVPTQAGIIRLVFLKELESGMQEVLLALAKGNPEKPRMFDINSNPDKKALRPYASQSGHMFEQLVDTHIFLAVENGDENIAMEKISDCIRAIHHEFSVITYAAGKSPNHTYAEEHSIKTDYSYHEHENGLLINTYGAMMYESMAKLFEFWRGTDLRLNEATVNKICDILLEGYAYMRYKNMSPMTVLGRDVANADRPSYLRQDIIDAYITVCDTLISWGAQKEEELKSLSARFKKPAEKPHFAGTKYFWHSDFLSHNRENYQFTVHGVSNRIKRPESILKKNIKGMFLGDGCCNLLMDGYEYEGLAPCLNWRKLSGTTVNIAADDRSLNPECEIDTKIDTLRIFGGAKGTTAFVGGVSDGEHGAFIMDYDHLGVKAKKAYFCFDDRIVCLGAAIETENGAKAFTTLNQCRLCGDVIADGAVLPDGEHSLSDVEYIYSDSVGYVFFEKTEHVRLENTVRTGCWKNVDLDSGTEEKIDKKILLIGIEHKKASNDSYGYMLLPNVTEEQTKKNVISNGVTVLANTKKCQAVKSGECIMAVFYEPCVLNCGEVKIQTNDGCVILYKKKADSYRLYLSNPLHEAKDITVSLNGEEITFKLEAGFRSNNLGRPLCYDSKEGFLPYKGAIGD